MRPPSSKLPSISTSMGMVNTIRRSERLPYLKNMMSPSSSHQKGSAEGQFLKFYSLLLPIPCVLQEHRPQQIVSVCNNKRGYADLFCWPLQLIAFPRKQNAFRDNGPPIHKNWEFSGVGWPHLFRQARQFYGKASMVATSAERIRKQTRCNFLYWASHFKKQWKIVSLLKGFFPATTKPIHHNI